MANFSVKETSATHSLPMRYADFPSLTAALDYAARGNSGMNFYDRRNQLTEVLDYTELRLRAVSAAGRLLSLGLKKGDRVGLIAETSAGFAESFFACQYAGLIAVPLAIPMGIGQRASYITRLQGLINDCAPAVIISGEEWLSLVRSAMTQGSGPYVLSHQEMRALPCGRIPLSEPSGDDIAYLQYTSGSTRFPRGVIITQRAVMANLQVISHDGIKLRPGDRCVSWLPFYHDMGLVGFLLTPVATQLSVDYLRTQDFAMRPLQWLKLIDKNRGTVTVAPPFGYDLCLRRSSEKELAGMDLSCLRVAGVGAEPIPAELLARFSEHFAVVGANPTAFMPCYGLAENTLAVSFSDENCGVQTDTIDRDILEYEGRAAVPSARTRAVSVFVNCGKALPGHRIEIRNEAGMRLPEQQVGHICISGPSLMSGYFGDPQIRKQLLNNGWMDTGDLGYQSAGYLYVTGRKKDLIIIRGRNIWPRDIEYLAESEPEVNRGDAIAFVTEDHGENARIILQIQCRISSEERRKQLVRSLSASIQSEFGVVVEIELLPPHSLPRTSSGKPARAEARKRWMTTAVCPALPVPGFAP
ncbi:MULTISPECIES: fatty acyl-AMP ligase [Tatumella]|uniref:Fatty acyl-AMP ligase n=1 Tax=Tatumella punctata TaxID=399969 RepID=A0ABW1VPF8_9GAMM|nr:MULTISPECIES: fatty acyl-AMP ligase [unclassified Tatumella]MBS0856041.1 fatty acyl-AMP ligase [Tatumella sp. JGM16]MBS0878100.1 fatty acyl-AMP ligase [Tatumella sp. JGM82]MBS0890459.1 fatty acyl-AMP ligase [Tatumella sp. JGM94]MBS0900915.1 fatty acyl-AMP ligase [Tatumella sp. JGM100]MBS0913020.1 fatty acyl-AMP ligase [Tatumella sp. JGM91]